MPELSGTHYPNSEPDGLGELKTIARASGAASPAPRIKWGEEYRSWPIERRLDYAERLAASMNHAADLLQCERNALLSRVTHLEAQLKSALERYDAQVAFANRELVSLHAEKQPLYEQLVKQGEELRVLRTRLKAAGVTP